ncbi:hypothetical protein B0I35DRAFT_491305 [Stachybotrys elegans]|uniref:C2H2-type domain-containing protein n=1 Tax=Stachybotrys elegans TaxID=80388 RepID=A0A8K0SLS1_9HYPO|nr:hypothetical protein B0I35DRAFT_491305 [Stachybotrys elegans]
MAYCSHCQRPFPNAKAWEQHISNSSRHHICYNCNHHPDFYNEDELDEHLETEHHICVPCDRTFDDSYQLIRHDEAVHYICRLCRKHCESRSNLKNVSFHHPHAAKKVECFGCNQIFVTYSAMVLPVQTQPQSVADVAV